MKLSIIIPTYNSAKTLNRCLDSIVSQTFSDWEVLVMDGVSSDDTLKIAKSYNDPRIKIYSEPDKGIYDAMNKGIKKSQGEWLYFIGSDDWLFDERVLVDVLSEDSSYDVIYGDVKSSCLDKKHCGEWTIETIDYNRCHQAVFYKRVVFEMIGLYDIKYRIMADFYCNIMCFFDKRVKMKYKNRVVAYFSAGGVSSSDTDDRFEKKKYHIILKKGWSVLNNEQRILLLQKLTSQKKLANQYVDYCFFRFFKYCLRLLINFSSVKHEL